MKRQVERFAKPGASEDRERDAAAGRATRPRGTAAPDDPAAVSPGGRRRDLAHDLRSPLGAIANLMAILEEDHAARLDARGRGLLRRIAASADRAFAILEGSLEDASQVAGPLDVAWEVGPAAAAQPQRAGRDASDGSHAAETAELPEILLVEDDPREVSEALRACRRHGLEGRVGVARDGEEALSRLRRAADRGALPRVVFLDLYMPRLDGWAVLEALRSDARTWHVPVVVVSSSRRAEDVREAYRRGANSFLCKGARPGGSGGARGAGGSEGSPELSGEGLVEAVRYWLERNEGCP